MNIFHSSTLSCAMANKVLPFHSKGGARCLSTPLFTHLVHPTIPCEVSPKRDVCIVQNNKALHMFFSIKNTTTVEPLLWGTTKAFKVKFTFSLKPTDNKNYTNRGNESRLLFLFQKKGYCYIS